MIAAALNMTAFAGWALTALCAIAVSAGVYWIPIQVSDSLEIMEAVDELPSVTAAFSSGLHSSTTMLRPLRQVQTKALLNASRAAGDRYNPVFRGYHAAGAAALILLFGAVARPRSWTDVAALAFALTVLTGLHTFAGMMREAYPVNHFLLISLACLAALGLARSRGGLAADVLAVLCFVLAMLTLESGILVWVVAVAGYAAGARGISRRALIVMTVLLAGYFVLRIGFLDMSGNTIGDRSTGFGLQRLSVADQEARFGDNPWPLYVYTVVSSILTVPLSQPVAGQWTALQAYLTGRATQVHVIEIGTSVAATALIVWYLLGRSRPDGPRRYRDPDPFVALAVLGASGALSYAYAKSEIMAASGVLYALVAYAAAAEGLGTLARKPFHAYTAAALVLILAVSVGWGVRAVGLQFKLQRSAYHARNEWVLRFPESHHSSADRLALRFRLRDEALLRGRTTPFMLRPAAADYWGED